MTEPVKRKSRKIEITCLRDFSDATTSFGVAKSASGTITNPNANHQPFQSMSDKSIEERVKDIIVDQLGVSADQVTTEAKFVEDLGADSLDTVELVMAFEEEFDIEVPDEEAEKLQAVGDVITYINSQQG